MPLGNLRILFFNILLLSLQLLPFFSPLPASHFTMKVRTAGFVVAALGVIAHVVEAREPETHTVLWQFLRESGHKLYVNNCNPLCYVRFNSRIISAYTCTMPVVTCLIYIHMSRTVPYRN